MAGLAKTAIKVKKIKKHGVKAGQKSLIRPSQKKSVKNGRHQETDGPKKAARINKALKALPASLDGPVITSDVEWKRSDDAFEIANMEECESGFDDVDDGLYEYIEDMSSPAYDPAEEQ